MCFTVNFVGFLWFRLLVCLVDCLWFLFIVSFVGCGLSVSSVAHDFPYSCFVGCLWFHLLVSFMWFLWFHLLALWVTHDLTYLCDSWVACDFITCAVFCRFPIFLVTWQFHRVPLISLVSFMRYLLQFGGLHVILPTCQFRPQRYHLPRSHSSSRSRGNGRMLG